MTGHKYFSNRALDGEGELPQLSEDEREILFDWNNTYREYPHHLCIHQLFEQQAASTPHATAIVYQHLQLSYQQLNERANQLAHYLISRGIKAESRVGVMLERTPWMIITLLGVLKAGAAYVPIDPQYPQERIAFMLRDAEVELLITEDKLREKASQSDGRLLSLDEWDEEIRQQEKTNPETAVLSANLAYVIYTSGSTGTPKGVLIAHRSLMNLVAWHLKTYDITSKDRATQLAGQSFDATVWEIWPYLAVGASIDIVPEDIRMSPPRLVSWLAAEKITICFLPTPLAEALLREALPEELGLRFLLTGGDELHRISAERLPFVLVNHYGPTENTVVTTSATVIVKDANERNPPIGRAIENTEVYILDDGLEIVPVGVRGEIYIGGDGLARGYLNRAELTAERFIPNPYSREGGERLYRTGDIGRYLSNGEIEFLGRADYQVKIRGFRIELGEVESVLRSMDGVREAVVIVEGEETQEKRLVAYLVREEGERGGMEQSGYRKYLSERVPQYMIPGRYIEIAEMPMTANGKVDRVALAELKDGGVEAGREYEEGRDEVERELAKIWREVLGVDRIGVFDDFLELGGHSLKATQVIARVRNSFGLELAVSHVFSEPTVAGFALLIKDRINSSSPQTSIPAIKPVRRDSPLPLSFSQERVWFLQQLSPANIAYNFQATLRFEGQLNVAALERSLNEIVRRHEILRTTFPELLGRPVQLIHEPQAIDLPLVELLSLPENEREAELQLLIENELQQVFDLNKLPLIRWKLFRTGAEEHVLLHVEHHLLHDGWSFNVFLRELFEFYRSYSAGEVSPGPELPIQFADFAVWQREWLKSEVAARQLEFWRKKLAGSPPLLEMTLDHPRPATQSFRGAALRVELHAPLVEAIKELSKQEGVSLFMTMQAAFLSLLRRYTHQNDICLGSAIANRRLRETEGLIGMIINNVVSRTDLSGDPTFSELLKRVRATSLETYEHQDIPFDKVVEALQPSRALSYNPLFQIMFNFHDSPSTELNLPGLNVTLTEGLSNHSAKFDMNIIVIPRSARGPDQHHDLNGITLLWEYSTDLFEPATITRMIGHYQNILEAIVSNPWWRLSEIPLLSEDEREMLFDWNNTYRKYPHHLCIHQLFEQQAASTPHATAIVHQNLQLSYQQLNEKANQLAHYLISRGIKAESRVGIMLERTPWMIITLLGVLKAGAAYVPIDPQYPEERVRFMLGDAEVELLITEDKLRERLLERLPDSHNGVLSLDELEQEIRQQEKTNPETAVLSANLAYVIYTSGSTGTPKGVAIQHRSCVALLSWASSVFSHDELAAVLASTSVCFDLSIFEIFLPLSAGGCIILCDNALHLERLENAEDVTLINTVPSAMAELLRMQAVPDSVRTINLAGEALSGELVDAIYEQTSVEKVYDLYGPSEDTTYSTYSLREKGGRATIGRAIENTEVYILDDGLEIVPVGVRAEIYIGGDGLARGYLNRAELTAERFIPNPYSREGGGRLYRTGDIGRYLSNGEIEFLGRADYQVKIRGFRIELGEIEARLREHPEVREAVVVVDTDEREEKRLIAYLVREERGGAAAEWAGGNKSYREYLMERVPQYMIPGRYIEIAEMPMTANGKVDRVALAELKDSGVEEGREYEEGRDEVERELAKIWREVLGVDRIGVFDDFFKSGGHSLMAAQIVSRVRGLYQINLPMRSIFDAPTIVEFAALVEETLIDEIENLSEEETQSRLNN